VSTPLRQRAAMRRAHLGSGLESTVLSRWHRSAGGGLDLEPLGFAQTESERFYDQLLERVSALPAVEAAGLAYRTLPWTDRSGRELRNSVVVWQPDPEFARVELGGYVGGDLFQALGLEVLEGRGFIASDREGRPQVALVTEALATEFFGGDAVGRSLLVSARGQDQSQALDVRTVGIVEAPRGPGYLRQMSMGAVYLPARLRPGQPACPCSSPGPRTARFSDAPPSSRGSHPDPADRASLPGHTLPPER
jgi:hypothetical protein